MLDPALAARLIVGAIDAARMLKIVGADEDAPRAFADAIHELVLPSLYAAE